MNTFSVVVKFDIFKNIHPSLFRVAIVGALNKLVFKCAVEGFHNSVVIRIAFSAQALFEFIA